MYLYRRGEGAEGRLSGVRLLQQRETSVPLLAAVRLLSLTR